MAKDLEASEIEIARHFLYVWSWKPSLQKVDFVLKKMEAI